VRKGKNYDFVILADPDDEMAGIMSEELGFWTLSIVRNSKN
jgi:hypothetical protein